MRPTIAPGEPVEVRPLPAARLRVGDVVAVLSEDGTVHAHRLVRVAGGRLWTRGDAAPAEDSPHAATAVVGLVRRGGRAGALAARSPRLAPLLGALGRIRRPGDAPAAAAALALALGLRLARPRRA
ncbi:MAG TPA: S24/S26 family peptidase [Chloroflexota bacterium]|jgi:hypothetical protein|nr:S24/S26 family peptidase [Chloroflexota bacterium]